MQVFIDLQDKKTKTQHGIQNPRFSKSARERESGQGHKTKCAPDQQDLIFSLLAGTNCFCEFSVLFWESLSSPALSTVLALSKLRD